MIALARWALRSPVNATLLAFVSSLIPWLFWLGTAIAALVTLRRGLALALPVLIGAALPLGWWWTQGDAVPLATLLLTTLLAVILRARARWGETLIAGALVSALLIKLGVLIPPNAGAIVAELRSSSTELDTMLSNYAAQGISVDQLTMLVMGALVGIVVMLASVACLALGRSWQAALFNPGGFREEFHAFRLAPKEIGALLLLSIVGFVLGVPSLILVSWIPVLIAGIALVHAVIGIKGMSGLWLGGFYILLLMAWPAIVIVLLLALFDSALNVRARLAGS
ncbi:hypothetical protein [Larsenimonas salina]|uniref:hypothetical protein n=1 Tax=Larsenimonas salina TaxID=1295565 RepID=UPI0020734FE5|nr:hypothetical protein [Larsenimonas salina]MCM5703935.1 hypothetical protein [Larsenimonas salina]